MLERGATIEWNHSIQRGDPDRGRRIVAFAVACVTSCMPRPPSGSDLIRKLAQDGYTPNVGLSGLYEPGNIIQNVEPGPEGNPRPLSPPIVLAWATDCFPQEEPKETSFAVSEESSRSSRAFSLQGPEVAKFLPGLGLETSGVSEYRLSLKNPRLRAFARADLSERLSARCVDALSRAMKVGDRPEWFSVVLEAVVVDSLHLQILWKSGVEAAVRDQVTADAAHVLDAAVGASGGHGAAAKIKVADETSSAVEMDQGAIVAYRSRPLQALRSSAAGLRDQFHQAARPATGVGRLALRDLSGGAPRRVRLDHAFRSGDAFQFEVTSNRGGWLFVLHVADEGAPTVLWPPSRSANLLDGNEIAAHETMVVPPDPAMFRMDERAGLELFYVVIRSDREPPRFGTIVPFAARPGYLAFEKVPDAGSDAIVQFAVRSGSGVQTRGVVFDPGAGDPDPSVYFAAAPANGSQDAIFEFRLTHVQ